MRELGALIRTERERHGLTQEDVGGRVGIARSYVSKIERGDVDAIGYDVLVNLSAVLGVPRDRLEAVMRDEPLPRRVSPHPVLPVAIPVVAQSSGSSRGGGFVEDYLYLPPDEVRGLERRAIRVEGDCMAADGIVTGDYVLYTKDDPLDGDVVLALRLDTGELLIKRLYWQGELVELRPSDGQPSIVLPKEDVHLEGVVRRRIRIDRITRKNGQMG